MTRERLFAHEWSSQDLSPFQDRRVTFCGVGALGSHIAASLAGKGFRNFRLIDFDRVEDHNRANQLYYRQDIGAYKARVLAKQLWNATECRAEPVCERLTAGNAAQLLAGSDVVVVSFDNHAGRAAAVQAIGATPCLHAGLSAAGTGEVRWQDHGYEVPPDVPGDPCALPLSRGLVELVSAAASQAVARFLLRQEKQSYLVLLEHLAISPL